MSSYGLGQISGFVIVLLIIGAVLFKFIAGGNK